MKNILLLDDDPVIHEFIAKLVSSFSFKLFSSYNVIGAEDIIGSERIDFIICDLYLDGDRGDQLSNDFIRSTIVPRGIPYCRFTSAPSQVPVDCIGVGIIDKRQAYSDDSKLYEILSTIV